MNTIKGIVVSAPGQLLNDFYPKVSVDLTLGWNTQGALLLHTTPDTLPSSVTSTQVIIQPAEDGWGTEGKEIITGTVDVPGYRQTFMLSQSGLAPAQSGTT